VGTPKILFFGTVNKALIHQISPLKIAFIKAIAFYTLLFTKKQKILQKFSAIKN